MPERHIFKIEDGVFGLSLTAPTPTPADACAAVITSFTEFTCQITSGAINASANVTDDTVPATWCSPESTTQQVGETSFTLDLSLLQDPDVSAGISAFLFTHDTELVYWFVGLAGGDPPQAYGSARCIAGTIGGEARVALTADVSLPIQGKPFVCFGDATTSVPVSGTPLMAAATFTTTASSTSTTRARRRPTSRCRCEVASGNVIAPYLARLERLPAEYVDEAVAIFARVAERNGGHMMGRYQLTAEERDRRVTPEGATVLMVGTPAGFWVWAETGASGHTIRPRRKQALAGGLGHPVRGPVRHPGFAGRQAWTRTVTQATEEIDAMGDDLAARAAA